MDKPSQECDSEALEKGRETALLAAQEASETSAAVFRRKVFYIPGYDPFPPRRYRELYRKEGKLQAEVSGYQIEMLPKAKGASRHSWKAALRSDEGRGEADIEVLLWSDIVQASMGQSIVATYGQLLRTAWIYIGSGALWRLMQLRKGPVIAALYPVVVLLWQLGLALALIWVGLRLGGAFVGLGGAVIGAALGALAGVGLLRLFRKLDRYVFAWYLMHDYAWSARYRGAHPPELLPRLAEFERQISEALRCGNYDEVLVVGHSSGAHLGVSVLANLLREGAIEGGGMLSFLSLGHVVPMVSFLPAAQELRRDLHDLAQADRLTWVDVSAPGDGCSFALCDPVAVSGVAPQGGQLWPLVISAAFSQTLSDRQKAALKRRYFRLHFQYLCAFERPSDYDYFQITAGAQPLGQRFAGRKASASRMTRALSGYQDRAA